MSEATKPKACPFCGRSPSVFGYPWAHVSCVAEGCVIRQLVTGRPNMTVPNAVRAWNRRPRTPGTR